MSFKKCFDSLKRLAGIKAPVDIFESIEILLVSSPYAVVKRIFSIRACHLFAVRGLKLNNVTLIESIH